MDHAAPRHVAGAAKAAPQVVRTWLRIEPSGDSNVLQADKYKLTTKLGIQTRDLRLLDPHFTATYPSCILCREKSIVVNLEHIKVGPGRGRGDAVPTLPPCSLLRPSSPPSLCSSSIRKWVLNFFGRSDDRGLNCPPSPLQEDASLKFISALKERLASPHHIGMTGKMASVQSMGDLQKAGGGVPRVDMALPFELKALEICLDEVSLSPDLISCCPSHLASLILAAGLRV